MINTGVCKTPDSAVLYENTDCKLVNTNADSDQTYGWVRCQDPGYYVSGFYRGAGGDLNTVDMIYCCMPKYSEKKPSEV